jgi:hypothetical protein
MRIASGWHRYGARALALAVLCVGLALAAAGPTPAGATEARPPVAPPAPARHGGGFALVLLGYRQALEQLTLDLRGRAAELADGAEMAPAELAAAVDRVTAGADPLALIDTASCGPSLCSRLLSRVRSGVARVTALPSARSALT